MTDMDILKYEWQGMLVALAVCAVIGLIKTPIKSAIRKKTEDAGKIFGAVAFLVSVVSGAGAAVLFSAVFNCFAIFSVESLTFMVWVVSASQFFYAMYEKLGIRLLGKKIIGLLAGAFGVKLPEAAEKAIDLLPEKKDPAESGAEDDEKTAE